MNPDQTINFNHNAAECIKSTSKIGETIYMNICNGSISSVPWGGADWIIFIFLCGMALCVLALLVGIVLMLVCDL